MLNKVILITIVFAANYSFGQKKNASDSLPSSNKPTYNVGLFGGLNVKSGVSGENGVRASSLIITDEFRLDGR